MFLLKKLFFLALLFLACGNNALPMEKNPVSKNLFNEKEKIILTPIKQKHIHQTAPFVSPGGIVKTIINYCSDFIEAINKNNLNEIKRIFTEFYTQIPYTMHHPDKKEFYQALSIILCDMLQEHTGKDKTYFIIDNGNVIMPLETDNIIYVLEFRARDKHSKKQNAPLYVMESRPDKDIQVITFDFLVNDRNVKIYSPKNNGAKKTLIKPVTIAYNEDNKTKNMVHTLADSEDTLSNFLTTFYNKIPAQFRVRKEKYFQALLFLAIKFIGNSDCDVEVGTGEGRIDLVVITPKVVNIIEFKRNGKVQDAIDQINDRDYGALFYTEGKELKAIGINIHITKKFKKISKIEVLIEDYNCNVDYDLKEQDERD